MQPGKPELLNCNGSGGGANNSLRVCGGRGQRASSKWARSEADNLPLPDLRNQFLGPAMLPSASSVGSGALTLVDGGRMGGGEIWLAGARAGTEGGLTG